MLPSHSIFIEVARITNFVAIGQFRVHAVYVYYTSHALMHRHNATSTAMNRNYGSIAQRDSVSYCQINFHNPFTFIHNFQGAESYTMKLYRFTQKGELHTIVAIDGSFSFNALAYVLLMSI
jgi:hypothetical protein